MTNAIRYLLFATLILVALSSISVFAQQELPVGLQKIIDYNIKSTTDFSVKISFFIAFVAGILGILSPCILPFLPAYFSYTFKEKKNITKMTVVFFLGFSLVFVILGVIAGFIGEQSLVIIQKSWLVTIAGIYMVILGIITLFGKKLCSYIRLPSRGKDDVPGMFLFGMSFAGGWTACLGPILAGILGIGAILGNIGYSAILLFFYSLGNLIPLFILSMFYDRLNIGKSRFIQGKIFRFSIMGKEYYIHSTNLISGLLFLAIGIFLIVNKGTAIINTFDIFGTKAYFYLLQNKLLNWRYANIASIAIFLLFIIIFCFFAWKYLRRNKTKT